MSRNEFRFNHKVIPTNLLEELIKIRSFHWGVTVNKLRKDVESIWKVNPIGSILLSGKFETEDGVILWNTNAVGYVDGSWKEDKLSNGNSLVSAGIGGYLVDSNKLVKYMFSGLTEAWCPLEAERNAVLHLYKVVKFSPFGKSKSIICTDNLSLVDKFKRERLGWDNHSEVNL